MEERIKEIESILKHKYFQEQFKVAYMHIERVYSERANYAGYNKVKLCRSPLDYFFDSLSYEQARDEVAKVMKKESKLSKSQRNIVLTLCGIAIRETKKLILNDRKK